MPDQVLYRKYRSASFDEVVGQDHVVTTLKSALTSGRLSHAYLFTGPRGTGKTSVARLLARALNCTGEPKPCNKCNNCLAAINSSLDVIEIDAASNRSIDAVRDLKDKIALAPTSGRYKIYIIDEVHMLTSEAFNALLKTLEEPPAHAVFVLATTEAHKLPETIISRTQRFTFKPINRTDLTKHLNHIAASEKITVEPDAMEIITATARGSFRDAISLLDQVSGSGQTVTAATVRELLGYSSTKDIAELSRAIAGHDVRAGLEVLARLEAAGAQPGQIAVQLAETWRSLLLASAGAANITDPALAKLASSLSPAAAAATVTVLLEVTRSHWPGPALEAAVAQLASPPQPSVSTAKTVSAASPGPVAKTTPEPQSVPRPAAKPAPVPQPKSQAALTSQVPAVPSAGALSPNLWPKVLVLLKTRNNSLCALLQMYPADFDHDSITIKPRFNFHRDLFLKPTNLRLIEAAAAKVYGTPVKIFARTDETASGARPAAKSDPSTELISSALEILGGEVVD